MNLLNLFPGLTFQVLDYLNNSIYNLFWSYSVFFSITPMKPPPPTPIDQWQERLRFSLSTILIIIKHKHGLLAVLYFHAV